MNPSRTSFFFFVLLVVTFSELAHCLFETGQPITIEHWRAGSLEADITTSLSDSAPIYSYVNTTVEIVDDQIIITSDNADGACPGSSACNVQFKLLDKARAQPNFLRANVSSSSYDIGTISANVASPNEIVINFSGVACSAVEGDICEVIIDVTFSGVMDPNITSVVPSQLPPAGALVTISGSSFSSAALVNISKSGKNAVCDIVSATVDTIVCRAPAGTGAGYILTVTVGDLSATKAIKYAEPYLTGSKSTINDWQTFLTLYGGNFNPKDVKVEFSQDNKKRSAANPTCEVISATTSQIDCALNGIVVGALNAVVRTGGAVTNNGRPKVVAVVSKDAKTTSLTCRPPTGTPDLHQTEMCNCWSGYAPSDSTGTDCDNHAKCAQTLASKNEDVSDAPMVPETSFADDKLIIKQTVGIVSNRKATFMNFAVPKLAFALPETPAGTEGGRTCNFPGPLWTKSIDSLDCQETFEAVMPWSQNGFCGFVQDLNASSVSSVVYKSVLVTRFIEIINDGGKMLQRISQFSNLISVRFLAQRFVSSDASSSPLEIFLDDASREKFIQTAVVADSVYDVTSGNVLAYIKTTAAWPYQLNPATPMFFKADPVRAGVNVEIITLPNEEGDNCNTKQDSTCVQKFLVRINVGDNCDIAGVYTFRDTLYCRDVSSTDVAALCDVHTDPVEFTIRVKSTDLCDSEALDASKDMKTSLDAFFDQEFATRTSEFQTGDMIFWKLTIVNPQSSIDKVELNSVSLASSGPADVLLEEKEVTAVGVAVGFNYTNALQVVYSGDKVEVTFSHRYLRSALINTINVLSNGVSSVDVETTVVIDIYYHGNQKRATMDISSAPTQSTQSRSIRVVENYDNNGAEMQEGASSMSGSSSLVSSVALVSLVSAYLLMMM